MLNSVYFHNILGKICKLSPKKTFFLENFLMLKILIKELIHKMIIKNQGFVERAIKYRLSAIYKTKI